MYTCKYVTSWALGDIKLIENMQQRQNNQDSKWSFLLLFYSFDGNLFKFYLHHFEEGTFIWDYFRYISQRAISFDVESTSKKRWKTQKYFVDSTSIFQRVLLDVEKALKIDCTHWVKSEAKNKFFKMFHHKFIKTLVTLKSHFPFNRWPLTVGFLYACSNTK